MARDDTFDKEPTLEFKIKGDWTELDQEAQLRASGGAAGTFGSEGSRTGGFGTSTGGGALGTTSDLSSARSNLANAYNEEAAAIRSRTFGYQAPKFLPQLPYYPEVQASSFASSALPFQQSEPLPFQTPQVVQEQPQHQGFFRSLIGAVRSFLPTRSTGQSEFGGGSGISRRTMLRGMAAMGASAMMPRVPIFSAAKTSQPIVEEFAHWTHNDDAWQYQTIQDIEEAEESFSKLNSSRLYAHYVSEGLRKGLLPDDIDDSSNYDAFDPYGKLEEFKDKSVEQIADHLKQFLPVKYKHIKRNRQIQKYNAQEIGSRVLWQWGENSPSPFRSSVRAGRPQRQLPMYRQTWEEPDEYGQAGDSDFSQNQLQQGEFSLGESVPEPRRTPKPRASRRKTINPILSEYGSAAELAAAGYTGSRGPGAPAGGSNLVAGGSGDADDSDLGAGLTDAQLAAAIASAKAAKRAKMQALVEASQIDREDASEIIALTAKRRTKKSRRQTESDLESQADALLAGAGASDLTTSAIGAESTLPSRSDEDSANRIALIKSRYAAVRAARNAPTIVSAPVIETSSPVAEAEQQGPTRRSVLAGIGAFLAHAALPKFPSSVQLPAVNPFASVEFADNAWTLKVKAALQTFNEDDRKRLYTTNWFDNQRRLRTGEPLSYASGFGTPSELQSASTPQIIARMHRLLPLRYRQIAEQNQLAEYNAQEIGSRQHWSWGSGSPSEYEAPSRFEQEQSFLALPFHEQAQLQTQEQPLAGENEAAPKQSLLGRLAGILRRALPQRGSGSQFGGRGLSRRSMLRGMAAMGASAMMPRVPIFSAAKTSQPIVEEFAHWTHNDDAWQYRVTENIAKAYGEFKDTDKERLYRHAYEHYRRRYPNEPVLTDEEIMDAEWMGQDEGIYGGEFGSFEDLRDLDPSKIASRMRTFLPLQGKERTKAWNQSRQRPIVPYNQEFAGSQTFWQWGQGSPSQFEQQRFQRLGSPQLKLPGSLAETAFANWKGIGTYSEDVGYQQEYHVGGQRYGFVGTPLFGGAEWNVAFGLRGSNRSKDEDYNVGMTGTGNARAVMRASMGVMQDFITQMKPEQFVFTAEELSRQKLYNRSLGSFGGYVGSFEGGGEKYSQRTYRFSRQQAQIETEAGIENATAQIAADSPETIENSTSPSEAVAEEQSTTATMLPGSPGGGYRRAGAPRFARRQRPYTARRRALRGAPIRIDATVGRSRMASGPPALEDYRSGGGAADDGEERGIVRSSRSVYEGEEMPPSEGGGGDGEPPDEFTSTGRRRKEPKPKDGFSGFYMRFLALEGIRFAADVAYAYRQRNINLEMALGDPQKLGMAEVAFRHELASSVPFGIGKLGLFLRDPTGSDELSVTKTWAETDQNEMLAQGSTERSEQSRALVGTATIAESRGFNREFASIEEESKQLKAVNQQRNLARRQATAIKVNKLREAEFNKQREQQFGVLGPSFIDDFLSDGIDYTDYSSATAEQTRLGKKDSADLKADEDARERIRIAKTAEVNFQIQQAKTSEANRSLNARDITAGLPWYERERNKLAREQNLEMARIRRESPQLEFNTQRRQDAEAAALETMIGRSEQSADIGSNTTVESSVLRGQGLSYQAGFIAIVGRTMAARAGADPAQYGRIDREGTQMQNEYILSAYRNESTSNTRLDEMHTGSTERLNRNPLRATLADIAAARDAALSAIPQDEIYDERREKTLQHYNDQMAEAKNRFNDNVFVQTNDLKLRETVTGLLAKAYGPGGQTYRREAQITQIGGEAENRAEQILLVGQGATLDGRPDPRIRQNADRERRIGINELNAYRAQYLEGFKGQEGSLNRTNLSGVSTGNPTEVLKSIDNGIKQLTGKIGTLVATD